MASTYSTVNKKRKPGDPMGVDQPTPQLVQGPAPAGMGQVDPLVRRMGVDQPGFLDRLGQSASIGVARAMPGVVNGVNAAIPKAAEFAGRSIMQGPGAGVASLVPRMRADAPQAAPTQTAPTPPPVNPQVTPGAFGGMGDVRMAERQPMAVDRPPVDPYAPIPLPGNPRKDGQRARADYLRTLHSSASDFGGDNETRIAAIRAAEDRRDAFARSERPVQKVLDPQQQAGRYNELRGQMFGQFNNELKSLTDARTALDSEPLSADKQNQAQLLDQQIAAKRAQIEKAVGNWGDLTPDQAAARTAGSKRVADRQMADRAQGAADVGIYRQRDEQNRAVSANIEANQRRQAIADQRAALAGTNAQTAEYNRQGAGTGASQIEATTAARDAASAEKVRNDLRPGEEKAAIIAAQKADHPEWQGAANAIVSGIKAASGKQVTGDARDAYDGLIEGFQQFQSLPAELQQNAAAGILDAMAGSGLSLPKQAFQDDRMKQVFHWLVKYTTPEGWAASAVGYEPWMVKNTRDAQDEINGILDQLRKTQGG